LRAFDDGVYLHQVIVRGANGDRTRFVDLPDALAAFAAGRASGEWRIHCHVPVFLEDLGAWRSTRPDLQAALDALRHEALTPHLEVETYTWDVLPAALKAGSKADGIARELAYVLEELEDEHGRDTQRRAVRHAAAARAGF
jgi:hypothetical protein